MAVGFFGFGASIRTRQEIEWFPVCEIYFSIQSILSEVWKYRRFRPFVHFNLFFFLNYELVCTLYLFCQTNINQALWDKFINRPGVAWAVLQTPSSFINSLIH